ncbi:hypothetical protein ACQ0QQ_03720 [Lysinibacillus sphaericus]
MNMLWMFLPILIILLMTAGVAVFLGKMVRKGPKTTRWIVGGYTLILLAAAIISFSMTPENVQESSPASAKEIKRVDRGQMDVMDAAHSGRLIDLEGLFTSKKSWTFPYDGEKLKIEYSNDEEGSGVMVFVQQKETEDGIMEAVYYTGNAFVDGMDMTEEKLPAGLELQGGVLTVREPGLSHVNITMFSPGFPYQQFSDSKTGLFADHHGMGFGQDFILLKVPQSVKVEGQTNYITWE